MAEIEGASVVEATNESQDSQKTIEYSLSLEATTGSPCGDIVGHPEEEKKADLSAGGKPTSPGVKNPQEKLNIGESQGEQAKEGDGSNNINEKELKTNTQGQVSAVIEKDNKGSQNDGSSPGKSENSALTESMNRGECDGATNQTAEGVIHVGNTDKYGASGKNESQDPSSKSEKADNQDSQEASNEPMEQDDGESDEMEVDETTGQSGTSASAGAGAGSGTGAGREPKHTTGGMDDDGDLSSGSSDDEYHWGRPWASRDTQLYRAGYPDKRDNPHFNKNYEFYTNRLPSEPDGNYIEYIHKHWKGDYRLLEIHHGYIQWLFPIRESGLNWHAQELQLHEIEKICDDPEAHQRILTSYELMLDFYGMKLKDPKTGEIERAENWQNRFHHLNHSMHNYLRITRILKCLGEFNYEHLKAPFVQFVLHEAIVEQTLKNTTNSCLNYWLEVIKDEKERKQIKKYARKLSEHKNRKK